METGNASLKSLIGGLKNSLRLAPNKIIGFDVGSSSIKIAELHAASGDSFKLVNFYTVSLPEGSISEDEILRKDEIVEVIKEAIEASGVSNCSACIGLSGSGTLIKKLQLAGGNSDEIDDQILWEIEQYLPFEIDDAAVSYDVLGENMGGGVDAIVAAAKEDLVTSYKALLEEADMPVRIVDMDAFALINIFEHAYLTNEEQSNSSKSWVLIDFGAQKTKFMVYRDKAVVFLKELSIGGVLITEEIQRKLGVNYFEAEDLKTKGDEDGNLPEEILSIIDENLAAMLVELKKTIDFYVNSTSDEAIEGAYITGGNSLIPGLLEDLEANLGVEVNILNPFERIDYDRKKFDEEAISSIAYIGTVALGLGMRIND
ncbi:MAG: type IV pilus assembly protein PilM [Bacteriovoracaceae bacterium]|nr:type IV pilus assembly protein PilM [Bacteriovoracaceae bacterium]